MESLKEQRMFKERQKTPRMILLELLDKSHEINEMVVSVALEDTTIETHLSTSNTVEIVGMLEISKKDVMELSEIE